MNNIWRASWQHCDWAGKADLLVLVILSLVSWYIIFEKLFQFREVRKRHALLEESLQRGNPIPRAPSPLLAVWQAGQKAVKEENLNEEKIISQMETIGGRELEILGHEVSFLAVISTVSPFLGLWGTVWGLLIAFNNIALTGSSSIRVVASGVAEALITTVVGLLVAIPAATAHSYFASVLKTMANHIDSLIPEIVANLVKKLNK